MRKINLAFDFYFLVSAILMIFGVLNASIGILLVSSVMLLAGFIFVLIFKFRK